MTNYWKKEKTSRNLNKNGQFWRHDNLFCETWNENVKFRRSPQELEGKTKLLME
jgi:hypothetical protein